MKSKLCLHFLAVICLALLFSGRAGAQQNAADALALHMQHLLNDGDQWQTPNPDFEPGGNAPEFFGLTFTLAPDGSHATGKLEGLFENGRSATYWSLLAFYNPVTEKVITKQIGWDGALLAGEVPLQTGDAQIIDMIHYNPDGTLNVSRHENQFDTRDEHVSHVYKRDVGNGNWHKRQTWVWRRQALAQDALTVDGGQNSGAVAETADEAKRETFLEKYVGYLVSGSGSWRAPNPDYAPGSDEPSEFGMNYSWGPYRRHVVGEIVSVYESGRVSKDWSLYITYNPVTEAVLLEQTGKRGVYFVGELSQTAEGVNSEHGLIFLPNGTVKSVHDRVEIVDGNTRVSHVYERAPDGKWIKVREWTWRRQPVD